MLGLCISSFSAGKRLYYSPTLHIPQSICDYSSRIIFKNTTPSRKLSDTIICHSDEESTRVQRNKNESYLLQVFSSLVRRLRCYPCSWLLPCNCLTDTTKRHAVNTHNFSCFCGPYIPRGLRVKFSDKKRRMSIASLLVGQSIKPGLFFSALGNCRISRCRAKSVSLRYDVAAALCNGSWKATMDVRSKNWLLARHSAWLLFGICTYSVAAGTGAFVSPPALAEPLIERPDLDEVGSYEGSAVAATASCHGKQVLTNYSVIGIPGDGRCLFRAVAHGAEVRNGKGAPSERLQRECADSLREKVVDELVKRRSETEWFIEGDFDSYTKRMRQPYVWGGEPELLMASHVLRMPITVYMFEQRSGGLISIAEYGQEYGKENPVPVRVLYHGFGHYDALQLLDHGT